MNDSDCTMLAQANRAFVDPERYLDLDSWHRVAAWLRRNDPVHRVEVDGFDPFYALTRHADIIEIELAGASPLAGEEGQPRNESLSEATERHLRQYFTAHRPGLPSSGLYERVLREVERPLLGITLEATRGNQIKAAELLGINRNTLRKKIRELDIEISRGVS